MSCDGCKKRDECKEICPSLARQMPSMSAGSLAQFLADSHQTLREVYDKMKWAQIMLSNRTILNGSEAEVFELYYIDSLTVAEIAEKMSIRRIEVASLLRKAYNQIRQYVFTRYRKQLAKSRKRDEKELEDEL